MITANIFILFLITYFSISGFSNDILKKIFFIHFVGILFMIIVPGLTNGNILDFEILTLINFVLFFTSIFFSLYDKLLNDNFYINFNNNEIPFKNFKYIILYILAISIIFFLLVYQSIGNILLLRAFEKSINFPFILDILKYQLTGSWVLILILILKLKINIPGRFFLILLFTWIGLLLYGFGSRNILLNPFVALFLVFYIDYKTKNIKSSNFILGFLFFVPIFIFYADSVTSFRNIGVDFFNFSSSISFNQLANPLNQYSVLELIYSQNKLDFFSFSFINFPFQIYFDFLISIIPTEFFNFMGLEKNVYNSFIKWNFENALVGNITPSYFGQLILENRFWGIFFFPLNFLLIIATHIYVINKYIKNNFNHILYLTFISLLLSSILNSTRMLNFIYFAPFWFILPLLFLYKKNEL